MMTIYLGKEYHKYSKKFNDLKEEFMSRAGSSSNAAIFRFIIDVLHDDLEKRKAKARKLAEKESQRREKKD